MDWIYIGIYSLVFIFSGLVIIVIWALVGGLHRGREEGEQVPNWPFVILLPTLLIPVFLSYSIVAYFFGLYPSAPTSDEHRDLSASLSALEQKAASLKERFTNPKSLTLQQLEDALSESLQLTEEVSPMLVEQRQEIERLLKQVNEESKRADEAKKLAASIQSLTKEQVSAVKLLITEDAHEASTRSFYMGLIYSFPLGIMASIMAAWLYRRFTKDGVHPHFSIHAEQAAHDDAEKRAP